MYLGTKTTHSKRQAGNLGGMEVGHNLLSSLTRGTLFHRVLDVSSLRVSSKLSDCGLSGHRSCWSTVPNLTTQRHHSQVLGILLCSYTVVTSAVKGIVCPCQSPEDETRGGVAKSVAQIAQTIRLMSQSPVSVRFARITVCQSHHNLHCTGCRIPTD